MQAAASVVHHWYSMLNLEVKIYAHMHKAQCMLYGNCNYRGEESDCTSRPIVTILFSITLQREEG